MDMTPPTPPIGLYGLGPFTDPLLDALALIAVAVVFAFFLLWLDEVTR